MRFVDREKEQERLRRQIGRKEPSLIVVYGRRRLGKSTLLRHVLGERDIYFMADMTEEQLQRDKLAASVASVVPNFNRVLYPDWESLFLQFNAMQRDRFVLCLDEFPNMVRSCPSLPSVLQRLRDGKVLTYSIVLCGSSQQMMQGLVLDGSAPLYGRADMIMKLEPIGVRYLREVLGSDAVAAIEEYSVWGGVPRYWELREQEEDMWSAVSESLFDVNGTLYDEPSRLFLDDMKQTAQSASLLTLVGNGVNRVSEMAARLQKKATDISGPLAKLVSLGYMEREVPFGESPKNSKRSIYKLCDPFMRFYYRYVVPNQSLIGIGRKQVLLQLARQNFAGFVAEEWERRCRIAVSGSMLMGIQWGMASRWWGTTDKGRQVEIDVVAESMDGEVILIGECKWTERESAKVLTEDLRSRAEGLPFVKGRRVEYALFLKMRPDDAEEMNVFTPEEIIEEF